MRRRALLVACALFGCHSPSRSPEGAFRAFVDAAQQGEVERAWSLLSLPTRREVEARFEEMARAGARPAEDPAHMLLSGTEQLTRPIRDVVVAREEGGATVLKVTDAGGGTQEARMVQEQEGWRLDLTRELHAAPR